jgi:hypothetical protein
VAYIAVVVAESIGMNSQVDTEIDGPTLPAVSSPTFRTVIAKFKQFLKFDRELQRKNQEGRQRIEY